MPKDKAYFTTKSYWHNSNPVEQPYYHWMNVGIKTKGNLNIFILAPVVMKGIHADCHTTKHKETDQFLRWNYGTHKSYQRVFGKYTDFFGAHRHEDGMARYGPPRRQSRKKIWIWGLSQQGMIWDVAYRQ